MPAVIYSKKKDKVEVICAQGPAPAGATIEHYKGEGIDIIPGAAAYCDPDSADDNRNGVPDDLIQVASELNCNFNQFGIGNASGTINVIAAISVTGVVVSDDGTSDPVCIAGDPDPNNDPSLVEFCDSRLDSACDNPGQPGTGNCENVPDGLQPTFQTTSLTAVIRGELPILNRLAPGAIRAVVDLTDLEAGVHLLRPEIRLPEEITLVSLDPEEIVVVLEVP